MLYFIGFHTYVPRIFSSISLWNPRTLCFSSKWGQKDKPLLVKFRVAFLASRGTIPGSGIALVRYFQLGSGR